MFVRQLKNNFLILSITKTLKTEIMKKNLLLIATTFVGLTSFGQFDQGNAPAVGDGATLYTVDSMATAYENETGASATWNYSDLVGYANASKALTVYDASATPEASDYPNSTLAVDIENFLITYYTSTATERVSQGFIFTEPNLGDVRAVFDTDDAKMMDYPFAQGASQMDDFAGTTYFSFQGNPVTAPTTGGIETSVDGLGTLKLADNDYSNVTRYKIVDTTLVDVQIPILGGMYELIRTQYEYYVLDPSSPNSSLPIFVHASIKFGPEGGAPISDFSLVLSKEEPSQFAGLEKNGLSQTVVYPNPTSNQLSVQLPSEVNAAQINITDAAGRTVLNTTQSSSVQTIDVSPLNKGMYFMTISNGNVSTTKSVVIQ